MFVARNFAYQHSREEKEDGKKLPDSKQKERRHKTHTHKSDRNSRNCALYIHHVMEHTDLAVNVFSIS